LHDEFCGTLSAFQFSSCIRFLLLSKIMDSCVFCKIINRELPANIIFEDDHILAILDINPITDGHTLIIPKNDILDLHELDEITGGKILKVARLVANILKKEFKFEGVTILETNGAFQDVPHFHLHVFGRNQNQNIKIQYPEGVRKDAEHFRMISERMCNFLQSN
jgi:histidine triad (HIT) family protein